MFGGSRRRKSEERLKNILSLAAQLGECKEEVGLKWLYFLQVLKFTNGTSLSDKIAAFSSPVLEFILNRYPGILCSASDPYFWTIIADGIDRTQTHRAEEIREAIEHIRAKGNQREQDSP